MLWAKSLIWGAAETKICHKFLRGDHASSLIDVKAQVFVADSI